jgi:hypothetical protein
LLALLAPLLAISLVAGGAQLDGGDVPALLLFFSAGLISLALARVNDVQEEARAERHLTLHLNRRWLTMLIGLVVSMLFVSLLLSSVISLAALRALFGPLGDFLGWAGDLLYYLLLPLGFVVAAVVYLLRLLVSLLGRNQRPQPLQPQEVLANLRNVHNGHNAALPPELVLALKLVAVAVMASVALLLLARVLVRSWRPQQEGAAELHESVFDRAEFWAAVRALLLRLLARWRRRPRPAPVSGDAYALETLEPSARSMREIYRHLLARLAARGLPRQPEQTPYDYLHRQGRSLEGRYAELAAITDAYLQVRYGDRSPSEADLDRVRRLWAELDHRLAGSQGPLDAPP